MADKGQDRADRLKAALRENLKRRKAQTRGRAGARDRTGGDVEEPRVSPEPRES